MKHCKNCGCELIATTLELSRYGLHCPNCKERIVYGIDYFAIPGLTTHRQQTNEKATRIVQQYTLLSPEQIMGIVAMETNTSIIELKKRTRERDIVIPRHICVFMFKNYTKLTLHQIAKTLGYTNHTTIIHGERNIRNLYNQDEAIRTIVDSVEKKIGIKNYSLKN